MLRTGALFCILSCLTCTRAPTPSEQHPSKQAPLELRESAGKRKIQTSLYPGEIRARPLENHLLLDRSLFESKQTQDRSNLSAHSTLIRVLTFHASKCVAGRQDDSFRHGAFKSLLKISGDHPWSKEQLRALITDLIPDPPRHDILVSDVYVLDLGAWDIVRRRGEVLVFNQHMLAPEETTGSKLFWRVSEKQVCVSAEAEQERRYAAVPLGSTKIGLILSQGSTLGDYWKALEDWSRQSVTWPTRCAPLHSETQPASLDWPAFSKSIAFGGLSQAFEDDLLDPQKLGLECKGSTEVHHTTGMVGAIRPEPPAKVVHSPPGVFVPRDDSIPLSSYGVQVQSPYVWALVDLETHQVRAMGNLVTQTPSP